MGILGTQHSMCRAQDSMEDATKYVFPGLAENKIQSSMVGWRAKPIRRVLCDESKTGFITQQGETIKKFLRKRVVGSCLFYINYPEAVRKMTCG